MSASNFEALLQHVGHILDCVVYKADNGDVVNVAIECIECNEVLLDFDREEQDSFEEGQKETETSIASSDCE